MIYPLYSSKSSLSSLNSVTITLVSDMYLALTDVPMKYVAAIFLLDIHIFCPFSISRSYTNIIASFQVSEEYRLATDTLYLTVNLIDRYLSENYIEKQKLQLLGVTCMLIAS